MEPAPAPYHFPRAPAMVALGGALVELGSLVNAAELGMRSGGPPASTGMATITLFMLGWLLAFLGASAFLMRWTPVHRLIAVALAVVGLWATVSLFGQGAVAGVLGATLGSLLALAAAVRWPAEGRRAGSDPLGGIRRPER